MLYRTLSFVVLLCTMLTDAAGQGLWYMPPDERLDSIVVRSPSRSPADPEVITLRVAEATIDRYHLTVDASCEIWDTIPRDIGYYAPSCVCILKDSAGNPLDTLSDVAADGRSRMRIVDYRDQLKWDAPLFCIESIGNSDINEKQFIEYRQAKLSSLFTIDNMRRIARRSDSVIEGTAIERDDLVYHSFECPLEISIGTYTVTYKTPDVIRINFESEVLEEFQGYKIVKGARVPYTLTVGTPIIVDTIYRTDKLVRILVSGNEEVLVDYDTIAGKIQTDSAG